MRSALLALLLAIAVPRPALAISVYIEAGALTSSLAANLRAEVSDLRIADVPEIEAARIRVTPGDGTLLVRLSSADGAILLERTVPFEADPAPAVRVAALLLSEALAAEAPRPRASEPSGAWWLGAGLSAGWWGTPAAAQPLGLSLFLERRSAAGLAIGVAVSGEALCCELSVAGSTAPGIAGTPGVARAALTLGAPILDRSGGSLRLGLAVGADFRTVRGRPLELTAGAPASDSVSAAEALARAGLSFELPLGGSLEARLGIGAELRIPRLQVQLSDAQVRLDAGAVAPWAELGLCGPI
jgi:hypothetical protein